MATRLIIQVLAEEHANQLMSEVFSKEKLYAKVVNGYLSGTYGIKLSFRNWYCSEKAVPEFLYGEKVREITGMNPSELFYYEILPDQEDLDPVPFYELFPTAGYYKFGDIGFTPSTGYIHYKGNIIYSIANTSGILDWIYRGNDNLRPGKLSGLSKLWRRGFIPEEFYEEWKHELKDILRGY